VELVKNLWLGKNPLPYAGRLFVNPEKRQLKVKKAGGKQAKHHLYA
jgi:hypothetical protein